MIFDNDVENQTMATRYNVIICLIASSIWLIVISVLFISMLAIDECRDRFIPYSFVDVLLHILFFLSLVVHGIKVVFYGDRCSTPFLVVNIIFVLLIVGFGLYIIDNGFPHMNFDNVCNSLMMSANIVNLIVFILMFIGLCCIFYKKESQDSTSEEQTDLL